MKDFISKSARWAQVSVVLAFVMGHSSCDLIADMAEELSGHGINDKAGGSAENSIAYLPVISLEFIDQYTDTFTRLLDDPDPEDSKNSFDISEVYAATNGESLYFLVEYFNPVDTTLQLKFSDVNTDRYVEFSNDSGNSYENGSVICDITNGEYLIEYVYSSNLALYKVTTAAGYLPSESRCINGAPEFTAPYIAVLDSNDVACDIEFSGQAGICDLVELPPFSFGRGSRSVNFDGGTLNQNDPAEPHSFQGRDIGTVSIGSDSTNLNAGFTLNTVNAGATSWYWMYFEIKNTDGNLSSYVYRIEYVPGSSAAVFVGDSGTVPPGCSTVLENGSGADVTFTSSTNGGCIDFDSGYKIVSYSFLSGSQDRTVYYDSIELTNLVFP